MITAPYTSSIRSKSKMFQKGFIKKHFGMDYRDYNSVMSNFCDSAIDEVKKGDVRLYNKKVMPLISVEDAVNINIGKDIIEGLMNLSVNLLSNSNANEVRNVLKPYLMKELKSKFNIEFDVE